MKPPAERDTNSVERPCSPWSGSRSISGPRAAAILLTVTGLLVGGLLVLVVVGAGDRTPRSDRSAAFTIDELAPDVAGLYRLAAQHGDHAAELPCFCGCEEFLAHRNLEDCFVQPGGARAWEPHASDCGVCIAEATVLRQTLRDGGSAADARASVIATFGSTPVTSPPTTSPASDRTTT